MSRLQTVTGKVMPTHTTPPKSSHPFPTACEYVVLRQREIKVAVGIKFANKLTLK